MLTPSDLKLTFLLDQPFDVRVGSIKRGSLCKWIENFQLTNYFYELLYFMAITMVIVIGIRTIDLLSSLLSQIAKFNCSANYVGIQVAVVQSLPYCFDVLHCLFFVTRSDLVLSLFQL